MPSLQAAPRFTSADAVRVTRELFGLDATATQLPSERDQNFRLDAVPPAGTSGDTSAGDAASTYVLKIANPVDGRELLEAQNAALAHVASRVPFCPRILPTRDGSQISECEGYLVRLVTWLPGVPLGAVRHHSTALLEDLGRAVARLTLALQSFDHPAVRRTFIWDFARAVGTVREFLPLVSDRELRDRVERTLSVPADAAPRLACLPRSVVHNDANDYNVLVSGSALEGRQQVTGIIDFGDLLHSYTIGDLAIAIAYAMPGKRRPLDAAAAIVRGYHPVRRIGDDELAAVYPLVLLRICLSIAVAAHQQPQRPDDGYLGISQGPMRDILPVLAGISPEEAEATFRDACGESEALARRRSGVGRNVRLSYEWPVRPVRGEMQYLFDDRGRRYLDAYNNVPHVGHGHPRVADAIARQVRELNVNTRYLYDLLAAFAERLTSTLPAPLRVCYFVNSGSEANELALRLARAHTSQRDLIVLDAAYHGNTTTLIDISPYKFNGPGGAGAPSWVHVVPRPDLYRGIHRAADANAAALYAQTVADVIAALEEQGTGLCGFIAETCPSVAGQVMLPQGYLTAVYEHVRGAGGVCIADEVQTAYGRVGTSFYAFEDHGVVPDIVVLGKPIGNGYPLGAVVTTEAIAASFDNGMEFFSTFGGSPPACAAGLAVLDVVAREGLQAHALRVGTHLIEGCRRLAERHPVIGDVRGSGLFIGLELVGDRTALTPAAPEAAYVVNWLRENRVLIGTEGPLHNVLKIRPPMPFDMSNADHLLLMLDAALDDLQQEEPVGLPKP
jgi:4-aminobutyrate aminotransferase-like enzyme